MYLTKEQVEELVDTGIDEKIEKFVELFPDGTEVTYDLCIKHPDVFSFGLPGARLMPNCGWKAYFDRILKARHIYKVLSFFATPRGRIVIIHNGNEEWKPQKMFTWGPKIPLRREAPTSEEIDVGNKKLERIMREYNLELALIFYETSIM